MRDLGIWKLELTHILIVTIAWGAALRIGDLVVRIWKQIATITIRSLCRTHHGFVQVDTLLLTPTRSLVRVRALVCHSTRGAIAAFVHERFQTRILAIYCRKRAEYRKSR